MCLMMYSIETIITCEAKGEGSESQPLVGQDDTVYELGYGTALQVLLLTLKTAKCCISSVSALFA